MLSRIVGCFASPLIILLACIMILTSSKKKLDDEFLVGAKEGLETSFKILPSLIMLVCGVRMISASGAIQQICNAVGFFTDFVGIPKELVPVIIVRPFSGSAATAVADNLFKTVGPDSFAGRCASVLMGSSDNIVYTLAMYFSSAGIKKTRYALPASFIVLLFCVGFSVFISYLFFC